MRQRDAIAEHVELLSSVAAEAVCGAIHSTVRLVRHVVRGFLVSQFAGIKCDREGCDRQFPKPGTAPGWQVRIEAAVEYWSCDERGDFCPEHVPAEEVSAA